MTQAQINNDFVFASSQTDGTGLRITISRLAPNERISDWNETSSGTPIPIASSAAAPQMFYRAVINPNP